MEITIISNDHRNHSWNSQKKLEKQINARPTFFFFLLGRIKPHRGMNEWSAKSSSSAYTNTIIYSIWGLSISESTGHRQKKDKGKREQRKPKQYLGSRSVSLLKSSLQGDPFTSSAEGRRPPGSTSSQQPFDWPNQSGLRSVSLLCY